MPEREKMYQGQSSAPDRRGPQQGIKDQIQRPESFFGPDPSLTTLSNVIASFDNVRKRNARLGRQ